MKISVGRLEHIIDRVMDVPGWRLDTDDEAGVRAVLGRCESVLEVMHILSVVHFLEVRGFPGRVSVSPVGAQLLSRTWPALELRDRTEHEDGLPGSEGPWRFFHCPRCGHQYGPWTCDALVLVPQLVVAGYTWDLGVAASECSCSSVLFGLAEFDGYAVHRSRRSADEHKRATAARTTGLPVFVCREESHSSATWFDAVLHWYWSACGSVEAPGDPVACPGFLAADVLPGASEAA